VDCGGVIVLAAAAAGIPCGDVHGYRRRPTEADIRGVLDPAFDRLPRPDSSYQPARGDILLFDVGRDASPCHLGVYLGGLRFVHAYADLSIRRVSVALLCDYWRGMLVGVYRVKEE